jgi:hypothetical protein
MTTKKKCFEVAAEHNLTIDYSMNGDKFCSVDLPDGFLDSDGRTGLNFEAYEMNAKEFWKAVYQTIEEVVIGKRRWTKSSDTPID